jgi:hypothetical protein
MPAKVRLACADEVMDAADVALKSGIFKRKYGTEFDEPDNEIEYGFNCPFPPTTRSLPLHVPKAIALSDRMLRHDAFTTRDIMTTRP